MSDNLWSEDRLVPNDSNAHGVSFSPAAAVYNGLLYVFHHGRGNDRKIWYSTFDGTNWSEDRMARPHDPYRIDGAPALVVFNGKLQCFFRNGSDLQYFSFDGQKWGHSKLLWFDQGGMAGSPSVAVWRDRLFLALRSGRTMGGSDRTLYYFCCDSLASEPTWDVRDSFQDNWYDPADRRWKYGAIGSADGSPTLVVHRDRLHCFHKGTGGQFDTSQIQEIAGITADIASELVDEPRALVGALGLGALAVAGAAIGQAIKLNNSRPADWVWVRELGADFKWSEARLCPTAEDAYGVNSESIAAVSYLNKLVCIRQGRDDSVLWCGEHDGRNWLKDQPMRRGSNTFRSTGAPALVVYKGVLHCLHQGKDESGWMWMTTVDSNPPVQRSGGQPIRRPPSTMINFFEGQRVIRNGTIYIVLDGVCCHVPDPATYANLFGRTDGIFDAAGLPLATGPALQSGAFLGRDARNGAIYLVSSGVKRHIISPETMHKCGFTGAPTRELTPEAVDAFATGRVIDGAMTYKRYTAQLR